MIRAMLQRKTTKLINKHLLMSLVVVAFASTSLELAYAQKNQTATKKKSSDISLTSDDKIFLELREASKNNEASKAKDLGQKLSNYDIPKS
jgi:soluble lytic murein transglycosylase